MPKLIQTITIPRYITRIQTSKQRRRTYYKKVGGKQIPKKYSLLGFDKQGFLVDAEGERIVSNPRSHGKPKYEYLSGNTLTSGYSTPFMRSRIAREMHNFYAPFVRSMRPMTEYPLRIEWDFYTTVDKPDFDLSNFWFYLKYFEDTLTSEKIIPDDNISYITHSASPKLIPVDSFTQRKFVFRFYLDEREEIKNHPLWKNNNK